MCLGQRLSLIAVLGLLAGGLAFAATRDDVQAMDEVSRQFIRWDDAKGRVQTRAASFVRVEKHSTAVMLAIERKDGRRLVLTRCVAPPDGMTRSRVLLPDSRWWLEKRESLSSRVSPQEEVVPAPPEEAPDSPRVDFTTSFGRSERAVRSGGNEDRDVDDDAHLIRGVLLSVDDKGRLRDHAPDEARSWFPLLAEMAKVEATGYLSAVLALGDQFFLAVELSASFAGERNRTRIRTPSSLVVARRVDASETDEFARVLRGFPEIDSLNPFSSHFWQFSECDLDESGDPSLPSTTECGPS